jgi:hypothetical protein
MLIAPFFAAALGALTPREAIDQHFYLIGTWKCSFTVGDQGGDYATTWSRVLDGMWLEQTYDQKQQPHAEYFKARYFVGYDPRYNQWVRFGVMTTGQYLLIRMTDTPGGWGWSYAGVFKTRPSRSGYDTVFTRKSDTAYMVDGPTYPGDKGKLVTEHHRCRKTT